jgi:hypothetical protein
MSYGGGCGGGKDVERGRLVEEARAGNGRKQNRTDGERGCERSGGRKL